MEMKKSEDDGYIDFILRNLARGAEIPAVVHKGEEKVQATLFFGDRKGSRLYLQFESTDIQPFLDGAFDIALAPKDDLYIFNTKVVNKIEFPNNSYEIEKPTVTYSSLQRMVTRYKATDKEELKIGIDDHFFDVIDISTSGCSFNSVIKLFSINQTIHNFAIYIPNETIIYLDAIVKYRRLLKDETIYYGLSFKPMDWFNYHRLFMYVFGKMYPNIKNLGLFSENQIYDLYKNSGYLNLKSGEQIENNFGRLMDIWHSIIETPQIFQSIAYYNNEKPLASASLLRIYGHTFLGQSLASLPEAKRDLKSRILVYLGITDIVLDHPYFGFYLSYFNASLNWHRGMFFDYDKKINDKSLYLYDRLQGFECSIEMLNKVEPVSEDYNCIEIENPIEFIHFFRNNYDSLIADCYSYNQEDFFISALRQVYESVGLFLHRHLLKIERLDKLVAYVIVEVYTDGLNLYNILDMCRIYFIDPQINKSDVIRAAIPNLVSIYKKYKKTQFNIMFRLESGSPEILDIVQFPEPDIHGRVIMSKTGMREYRKLIALEYSRN